jgi:tRNA (mo5U34)-methyltransferase
MRAPEEIAANLRLRKLRSRKSVRSRVAELGPWFQNLRIDGVQTAPNHFLGDYPSFKWAGFSHVLPDDLAGRSVLDIGCNAGFYSIEMKRRNAGRVVGIDSDERYLAQARFAAEADGTDVEFRRMSVYQIGALRERFDLVIFMGVFYHLRHPLLALDLIHEHVADDLMLFQSLQRGWDTIPAMAEDRPFSDWQSFERRDHPALFFIEHRYASDPTNWFIPNRAGMEGILRSSGFEIEAHPEREVYLCRRGARPASVEAPPTITA